MYLLAPHLVQVFCMMPAVAMRKGGGGKGGREEGEGRRRKGGGGREEGERKSKPTCTGQKHVLCCCDTAAFSDIKSIVILNSICRKDLLKPEWTNDSPSSS